MKVLSERVREGKEISERVKKRNEIEINITLMKSYKEMEI